MSCYVFIYHDNIQDWEGLLREFPEWNEGKREHGSTGYRVYRDSDHPEDLVVVVDFPSLEKAESFASSIRDAVMKRDPEDHPRISVRELAKEESLIGLTA